MQSEPSLGHIDFDGLVVVRELAVHQNLPFEKSSKCSILFLLKKCKGAMEYERHCFSTGNHKHISAKEGMVYKH